jgi:hypothetical protein
MEEIQSLPPQEKRVETGVVQFGDDWPGVFIRGDNALYYAFMLSHEKRDDWLSTAALKSLLDLLSSCNTHSGK